MEGLRGDYWVPRSLSEKGDVPPRSCCLKDFGREGLLVFAYGKEDGGVEANLAKAAPWSEASGLTIRLCADEVSRHPYWVFCSCHACLDIMQPDPRLFFVNIARSMSAEATCSSRHNLLVVVAAKNIPPSSISTPVCSNMYVQYVRAKPILISPILACSVRTEPQRYRSSRRPSAPSSKWTTPRKIAPEDFPPEMFWVVGAL